MNRLRNRARRGSGGSSGFNPSMLGAALMKLWVRGDTGTVSSWTDRSGNGNHLVQGTVASQPTIIASAVNGRPAFRFDGTDDFMQAAFTVAPQPVAVFIVYKSITIGAAGVNDFVFDGNTVVSMTLLADTAPSTYIYAGTALTYAGNVANGAYAQLTLVYNGASSAIYENRTLRASGDAGAATPDGFTIAAVPGGGRNTNIEVAEVIVVASASATIKANVEGYMRARYATP